MKKELFAEIDIPEEVEVVLKPGEILVNGPEGKNERKFQINDLIFEKQGNKIIIGTKKANKKDKKMINTITAHIKNLIKGVQKKFEYKLKVCFSHFPFTVEVKGREVIIKNFLGEKVNRSCLLPEGVGVNIDKQNIIITSVNKELAGQAAANLEKVTKIRNRDQRIFQDGIYITNKNGKDL